MALTIAELVVEVGADIDGAVRGMRSVSDRMTTMGTSIAKQGVMLGAAIAPAALAFGGAVRSAGAFEEAMTNARAVLGVSAADMAVLNDEILRIGAGTRAGPQAAAEAFYDIVSGVPDATTHMAILTAAIATAEAGSADLGATTNSLVAIMNAYGFAADDATRVSDILTATVGVGVLTMEELAAAMPQVTGMGKQMGVEFEELGMAMAFLTTKGFSASEASTQIGAAMVAMVKPTAEMERAFRELGVTGGEELIQKFGGLQGALTAVTGTTAYAEEGMGALFGRVEAMKAVMALTGEGAEEFAATFADSIEGATEAAQAIQLESMNAQIDLLKSQAQALGIEVGRVLIPALTGLATQVRPVVAALTGWVRENPKLVTGVAAVVAGIAGLAAVMSAGGGLMTSIGTIGKLIPMVLGLSPPMLALVAAAALLGLAFKTNFLGIRTVVEGAIKRISDVLSYLKGVFSWYVEDAGILGAFRLLFTTFEDGSSVIETVLGKLGLAEGPAHAIADAINAIVGTLMDQISKVPILLNAAGSRLINVISRLRTVVAGPIRQITDAFSYLGRVFSWYVEEAGLLGAFRLLFTTFEDGSSVIESFLGKLGMTEGMAHGIADAINLMVGTLMDQIGKVPEFVAGIVDWFRGTADAVKAAFEAGGLADAGRVLLGRILAGLGDVVKWTRENITDPIINQLKATDWGEVLNRLSEVMEKFLGWGASALGSAGQWLWKEIVSPAISYLSNVNWAGVASRLGEVLEKAFGWGASALGSMGQWLWRELVSPAISYLSNVNWAGVASRLGEVLKRFIGWEFSVYANIGVWLWEKVIQPLGSYLSNVNWANVANRLLDVLEKFLGAAGAGLADVGTWIYEKIIQPIIDTFNGAVDAVFAAAKGIGQAIFDAILEAVKGLPWAIAKVIDDAIPNKIDLGITSVDLPDNPVGDLLGAAGFATGGIAMRPMLATVAEREPEAIIPLSRLGEMGGGGITITGPVYVQGVQNPAQLLEALQREARRRSSRLTTAMGRA